MKNYVYTFTQFNESRKSEEFFSDDAFDEFTTNAMIEAGKRKRAAGIKDEPKVRPVNFIPTPSELKRMEKETKLKTPKNKVVKPKLNTIFELGAFDSETAKLIIREKGIEKTYTNVSLFIKDKLREAIRDNSYAKFHKYFDKLVSI